MKQPKLAETISERKMKRVKKICNECKIEKPLTDFSKYYKKSCRSLDGFRTVCKKCRNAKEAERLRAKRERIKNAKIQTA